MNAHFCFIQCFLFFFLVFYTKIVNASLFFVVVIVLFSHVWINGVLNFALMDSNFTFTLCPFFFFFFFVSYLYDVCLSIGVSTPLTIAQASKAPTHTNANISKHASAPIETFLFFFLLCDEVTNTSEADEKKARAGGKKKKKDESCQK